MTNPVGQAIRHLGARNATAALATAEERGAGHAFEREFERAIVATWFAAGPVAHLQPPPTGHTPLPTGGRLPPVRGATSGENGRFEAARPEGDRVAADAAEPRPRGAGEASDPTLGDRSPSASPGTAPGPGAVSSLSRGTPPPMTTSRLDAEVPASPPRPQAGSTSTAEALVAGPSIGAPKARLGPATTPSPALDDERLPLPGNPPRSPVHGPPPPPIRLHIEADVSGARVWLGVDRAAQGSSTALVGHVRDTLGRSGVRLRGVVVNGAELDVPAVSHPRKDT